MHLLRVVPPYVLTMVLESERERERERETYKNIVPLSRTRRAAVCFDYGPRERERERHTKNILPLSRTPDSNVADIGVRSDIGAIRGLRIASYNA